MNPYFCSASQLASLVLFHIFFSINALTAENSWAEIRASFASSVENASTDKFRFMEFLPLQHFCPTKFPLREASFPLFASSPFPFSFIPFRLNPLPNNALLQSRAFVLFHVVFCKETFSQILSRAVPPFSAAQKSRLQKQTAILCTFYL